MSKKTPQLSTNKVITLNKRSRYDYFIEDRYEAGIVLQGWEVKAIRAGRVQLKESHVLLKNSEAYLFGALISPLASTSTHIQPDPRRTRKLLLKRLELNRLTIAAERKGYTLVPTIMYWRKNRIKLEIGQAKGKKLHDKREQEKNKDWLRQKQRLANIRN